MHKVKHNDLYATIIKIACAFLLMTVDTGCTYETQTIAGKVVDESGVALSDVAVIACYSGWGWSSGYVVWDKDFCSEPDLTNKDGSYVINFECPDVMRLRARKDGWTQTRDFNATDSQIILSKYEVYSEKIGTEARLQEENSQQWLPDESETEYYCRVILSKRRPVTLGYQGESLSVVPILLKSKGRDEVLFAVRGSSVAANSFAKEVVFRINGQVVKGNFSFRKGVKSCEPELYFIVTNISDLPLEKDNRFEIFVPGIRAMLDMQIWQI